MGSVLKSRAEQSRVGSTGGRNNGVWCSAVQCSVRAFVRRMKTKKKEKGGGTTRAEESRRYKQVGIRTRIRIPIHTYMHPSFGTGY